MKPFNLEEAKQGKPVCTRDGRPARILCFDAKGGRCSIVALIDNYGNEGAYWYDKNGRFYTKERSINDLMMVGGKHTGWINIYKDESACIWGSEREAREYGCTSPKYLATAKIEWEE